MVKSNLTFRNNSQIFSPFTQKIIVQLGNEMNFDDEEKEVYPPEKKIIYKRYKN